MSKNNNNNNRSREELRKKREYLNRVKPLTDRMKKYQSFVDKDIINRMEGSPECWNKLDIDGWISRVNPIIKRLPDMDYDNNILFICNEKITRETFFAAFWKLGLMVENRYLNVLYARDLWYGRCEKKILNLGVYVADVDSFREIKEDVICTYASSSMAMVEDIPKIWTTVISSMFVDSGEHTKHQDTWIYFDGTIEELRNSEFNIWEPFFERNGVIIDLNVTAMNRNTEMDNFFLH